MGPRLKKFNVTNLFGLYSHSINFNTTERITAIIGPNGRGKTVCLKLIEALFNRDYYYLLNTNFEKVEYYFTSGDVITISKQDPETVLPGLEPPDQEEPKLQLIFHFLTSDGSETSWNPLNLHSILRRSRRITPFLYQVAPRKYYDERTSETLTTEQVLSRYSEYLPRHMVASSSNEEPKQITELLNQIKCHLVETQRLILLPENDVRNNYEVQRGQKTVSKLVVEQEAEKLKGIIQAALSQYATLSQLRDRSFPRRVIEAPTDRSMTEEQLRDRLNKLDLKRLALMKAGILEPDVEAMNIGERSIDERIAQVLEIYVKDTEEKLQVFDNLLAKIDIFLELVNHLFIDKDLIIDRKNGFRISNVSGKDVPLDKLSSGEQHHLVIVFELLFDVDENSLILIDEPELSLHVLWQKNFIDGLRRMIRLSSFDAVLATHSPILVARHKDLVVELGDVDEVEEQSA